MYECVYMYIYKCVYICAKKKKHQGGAHGVGRNAEINCERQLGTLKMKGDESTKTRNAIDFFVFCGFDAKLLANAFGDN